MFVVADNYPGDAARGGCYLSGAAQGEIVTIDPATGGEQVRREKVIVTPVDIDFEGRLCIGERMVRHLAHQFGMVDSWRVERLRVVHDALVEQATRLGEEVERLREDNAVLAQMVDAGRTEVFVSVDGTCWPKKALAVEASRRALDAPPLGCDALRSIMADEAPLPEAREKVRH